LTRAVEIVGINHLAVFTNTKSAKYNTLSGRRAATLNGGLVKKASVDGLVCTSCGQDSVIQIEMTLPDGTEVVFCSCHVCEAKWWDREGESIAVDGIIDLVGEG
jgi:DNA-directed RNA polymerase subunit M/transcription elongation factor TFIIS